MSWNFAVTRVLSEITRLRRVPLNANSWENEALVLSACQLHVTQDQVWEGTVDWVGGGGVCLADQ